MTVCGGRAGIGVFPETLGLGVRHGAFQNFLEISQKVAQKLLEESQKLLFVTKFA